MSRTPKQDAAEIVIKYEFDGVAPSLLAVADHLGPSRKYAYATLHRALKAGRIRLDPDHPKRSRKGKGAVLLVDSSD